MNQILSQSEIDALMSSISEGSLVYHDERLKINKNEEINESTEINESVKINKNAEINEIVGADKEKSMDTKRRSPIAYNITCQDKIIRNHFPRIDIIDNDFMEFFSQTLSSKLRKTVSLHRASHDFLQFGEWAQSFSMFTSINCLQMNTSEVPSLLLMERKLVYILIDHFFGGTHRPYTKLEGNGLTHIELSLVEQVIHWAVSDLDKAWAPIKKMDCKFASTETHSHLLGMMHESDVIVVSEFILELDDAQGLMTLVTPYSTLEPIKQKLGSINNYISLKSELNSRSNPNSRSRLNSKQHVDQAQSVNQVQSVTQDQKMSQTQNMVQRQSQDSRSQELWSSSLKEKLLQASVELKVNLGTSSISFKQLMNLKEGDIITLNESVFDESHVQIEDVNKYKARRGVHHGTMAIKITKPISK